LTLSFWVKCAVTGNFSVGAYQDDSTRAYANGYTINSANTWEKKRITIAPDFSGQIDNNNGSGFRIKFGFGAGTDYDSGSSGIWAAAGATPNITYVDSSWNRNLMGDTTHYLAITGVQLEVGDVATDFEYLPIDELIAKCQRYYCKSWGIDTAVGTATWAGSIYISSSGHNSANHTVYNTARFPVEMRTAATVTSYDMAGSSGKVSMQAGDNIAATVINVSSFGFAAGGTNGAANALRRLIFHYTADAEL